MIGRRFETQNDFSEFRRLAGMLIILRSGYQSFVFRYLREQRYETKNMDATISTQRFIEPPPMPRRGNGRVRRGRMFRICRWGLCQCDNVFAISTGIIVLAVVVNIPILHLLTLGYLLEVMGRLGRQHPWRQCLPGLQKFNRIGGWLVGSWLVMIPAFLISDLWQEAEIIESGGPPAIALRVGLVVVTLLTVFHLVTAWIAGGRLRHFLWPLLMPIAGLMWVGDRMVSHRWCPRWMADLFAAIQITDWFVPGLLWKRLGEPNVWKSMTGSLVQFVRGLRLRYYFLLGLKGFVGSFLWLLLPSLLLAAATFTDGPMAVVNGILGVLVATPVFAMLPFLQTHFAVDGRMRRFIEIRPVIQNFARSPWLHTLALLVLLLLALPLFLLKIEAIDPDLLWILSLVFLGFTLPARWLVGLAYRRGQKKTSSARWWLRYPAMLATFPLSLAFVLVLTLTRYTSWNGALSLFENHVFLLPAPFWNW